MTDYLAGVIGFPVGHSISPVFQQAALDHVGFAARYERWETPPERLAERIAALRGEQYLGANVTIPHKEQACLHVDEVEPLARRARAINTIYRDGGRLLGLNTDVTGFRRALRAAAGQSASGKRAVILGAGGAARAVVLALEEEGALSVAVANRHHARAERLVDDLRTSAGPNLVALQWDEATSPRLLAGVDLLVNCTAMGMSGSPTAGLSPLKADALHAGLFIFDIVANPLVTPLMTEARRAGAACLGGLTMLVYQGAAAFEQWTGEAAPIAVMMRAAETAMVAATRTEE